MKHLRPFLLLACLLAGATAARAQITVNIASKDRFHLLHEPVIVTVMVTNQTGHEVTLSDTQQFQWFAFRITLDNDRAIAPRDVHYHLNPLTVKSGETVKRSVDLNQLYELGEIGTYRIVANIYYDGLDKFYNSKPTHIEVGEGRVIWRKVAGVPEGQPNAGQLRTFSLLQYQHGEVNTLYVRVQDNEDGGIFCTFPTGRLLDTIAPQAEFDSGNNLYILQLVGNRSYMLTKVTCNGQFAGQSSYSAPKSRPTFRKTADGGLQLVGGVRDEPVAPENPDTSPAPKLSDRPVGLPIGSPK